VRHIAGDDPSLEGLVHRLIEVSRAGLPTMYRREERNFAFTRLADSDGRTRLSGESPRYAGIVLLGTRWLDQEEQRTIFAGDTALAACDRLLASTSESSNLGDAAIVAWAAAELEHPKAREVLTRLLQRAEARAAGFTVELAWVLSALAAAPEPAEVREVAERVKTRLMAVFSHHTGVFAHMFGRGAGRGLRSHVACFADQVYPIQALSRFHKVFGDEAALGAADRCADQICRLQGDGGQWWWHYDTRTGSVIEGYPVYSVHQDAMGPMALFDLAEAGGRDRSQAIRRGLQWMEKAPEIGYSLIDDTSRLIWRKVGRSDSAKLIRGVRAAASRVHPKLRFGILDRVFPPSRVDRESRPYHLGWVLHTWLGHL
jgi:hypothetical protein